jgi:adenosylmethionine-8-amino-7-oxononanoate aminotransferase
MARGMFSRVRGDVYCLAPPIVTGEDTIDQIVDIMAESTKAVLG